VRYMRASAPWVMRLSDGGGDCDGEDERSEREVLKGGGRIEAVVIAFAFFLAVV